MGASCLLFTPRVPHSDPDSFAQQHGDVEAFRRAVKQAELKPPQGEDLVVYVEDIYPELIDRLYRADFAVIDANTYSDLPIAGALYYIMAARHARDDRAILLARSTDHLPRGLRTRHTLAYSPEEFFKLSDDFEKLVLEILEGKKRPDNPIQVFLTDEERAAREAADHRRINELENRVRQQKVSPPITFRKVGKKA